jgi:hypothetical protein
MRNLRLNGWQRLGVVASVLWLPVGAVLGRIAAIAPYRVCVRNPLNDIAWCNMVYQDTFTLSHLWSASAFFALVPIPLAWLSVYVAICTLRWVWRGFQPAA